MPHIKFATNQSVPMQNASFTIGSDPTCDLPLKEKGVLPRHLILQSRGDGWQAATLSLHAIVFINDQLMDSLTLLKDGDLIRLGEAAFVWREQNAPTTQSSPWKGLLLIFLAVLTIFSAIFTWFGISNARLLETLRSDSAIESIQSPTLEGYNEAGHPIYFIELPPP